MNKLQKESIIYLAEKCIEKYDITDYEVNFIRHNENITLKVTNKVDNSKYLLRIHEPIGLNLLGIQHTYEGLNSEKIFLNELNKSTNLILQRPVLNKIGQFVSTINDIERNRVILCTLLTWIEGEKYGKYFGNSKEIAYEFGELLGKLHRFSKNWDIPQPFIRPIYDANKYLNMTNKLEYGVEIGLFTKEEFYILQESMNYIKNTFDSTKGISDKWGVIHADTHTGNIIVNSNKVSLIDFSFSGYGYYALDIGIALSSIKPDLRDELLRGYKTILEINKIDMKLINSSYLLSFFGAFAFNINNEENHDWLRRKVSQIVKNECKRLLNDEIIIYE